MESADKTMAVFENYKIRRIYDEKTETWYFSVIDIIQVLIQQPDYQTARKYWNKLKERLKKEGSQSVTNCHRLKLVTVDSSVINLTCNILKHSISKIYAENRSCFHRNNCGGKSLYILSTLCPSLTF